MTLWCVSYHLKTFILETLYTEYMCVFLLCVWVCFIVIVKPTNTVIKLFFKVCV